MGAAAPAVAPPQQAVQKAPVPAPRSAADSNNLLADFGDFAGAAAPVSAAPRQAAHQQQQQQPRKTAAELDRGQLVREREAEQARRIAEKASLHAEREKKDKASKEDRAQAGQELRADLDKWALNGADGKSFRDIRTLLATLHEVIWEGSTWSALSLGDLMLDPRRVKRAWQKAILISHPDRHNDADGKRRYRAERIFEAINESYKNFKP